MTSVTSHGESDWQERLREAARRVPLFAESPLWRGTPAPAASHASFDAVDLVAYFDGHGNTTRAGYLLIEAKSSRRRVDEARVDVWRQAWESVAAQLVILDACASGVHLPARGGQSSADEWASLASALSEAYERRLAAFLHRPLRGHRPVRGRDSDVFHGLSSMEAPTDIERAEQTDLARQVTSEIRRQQRPDVQRAKAAEAAVVRELGLVHYDDDDQPPVRANAPCGVLRLAVPEIPRGPELALHLDAAALWAPAA
ncbi:hypothetical protein [Streptomyces sp. ISL-87]|uniref:hypothetical protein n=1 Tax=Streptomyces sp. ISL-87 TaxID=2819188 RepID=UPI001BE64C71|nr:hypothetical protein [Streptomyces sp. ISL-87]